MDGKKSPTTPPAAQHHPAAAAPPPMDLATPPGFPTPMAYPPGFPTPVASQAPAVSTQLVAPPPGFPTPVASHPPAVSTPGVAPPGFPTPVASLPAFYTPGGRRGRGRPRGSANRARPSASAPTGAPPAAAAGVPIAAVDAGAPPAAAVLPASDASPGNDFIPHTMIIPPGEDLSMMISYFAEEMNPRAVCVISATGMISSSILSNSGSPNGVYRNDGDYDLTTLSGSYTYSSNRRYGNLKVVLTRHDEVVAGTVSGPLLAATPVIVVLGSFRQDGAEQDETRPGTESSPTEDSLPPQAAVY